MTPSTAESIDIASLIRQIPTQYPFVLVDRIVEHDPAGRIVAIKNVTGPRSSSRATSRGRR